MVLFIIVFCVLVALGLGVAAALSDLRGLIIPNAYSLGIVLAFVPAYLAFALFAGDSGYFQSWTSHLGAFALIFAASFVLFALKMFGAGDSKLAAAFALWAGMEGLFTFVFYMALIGGVLGLATLIIQRKKPFPNAPAGAWIARAQGGDNSVPYGVAIAAGAVVAFCWLGYASPMALLALSGQG